MPANFSDVRELMIQKISGCVPEEDAVV